MGKKNKVLYIFHLEGERLTKTITEMDEGVERVFKDLNNRIFLTEVNRRVVGFIVSTFSPGIARSGWISDIFVNEAFRQRGIGFGLMEKGIGWLKKKGVKEIEVTAYQKNQKALSLYKKFNFQREPIKTVRIGKRIV